MREKVPVLYEKHKQFLIDVFAGSQVFVILDETTDDRVKQVLNILLATPVSSDKDLIKPYLVDTVLPEKINSAKLGGASIRTLILLDIDFANVVVMISGEARYMKAFFNDLIKSARVNCVHIVCLAHVYYLNLVGEFVRKIFPIIDTFVAHMKTAFQLSFGKRMVYIDYLQRAGIEKPLSHQLRFLHVSIRG